MTAGAVGVGEGATRAGQFRDALEAMRAVVLHGLLTDRARTIQKRIWDLQDEMADPAPQKHLWSDEIEGLIAAAMATVSRNPSDHEVAIAYRRAIAAALARARSLSVGDAEALQMMGGNNG